jgi:hypothetical protein
MKFIINNITRFVSHARTAVSATLTLAQAAKAMREQVRCFGVCVCVFVCSSRFVTRNNNKTLNRRDSLRRFCASRRDARRCSKRCIVWFLRFVVSGDSTTTPYCDMN